LTTFPEYVKTNLGIDIEILGFLPTHDIHPIFNLDDMYLVLIMKISLGRKYISYILLSVEKWSKFVT